MKLRSLFEGGQPERIATGFQFTEGPVWCDTELRFSDIPAGIIYAWRPDGTISRWRSPSGHSNGLTRSRTGALIAAEHGNRRVSVTDASGTPQTLIDRFDGKRLNSPNDVIVRSDGVVFFTDPPYGIDPADQEQPVNGVYAVHPDGTVIRIADDFIRPNGLALSPDERTLYIDDSRRRHVRAFDLATDGTLTNCRILCDLDHPQPGSPDGMKVDEAGHIYVAGATGIWVFEPDGRCLGVIAVPELPANCTFGDADRKTLYITARTSIYRIRTTTAGVRVV